MSTVNPLDQQRHQEALATVKYYVALAFQFLAIVAEPVLILVTVLMVASDVTGGDLLNQDFFRMLYALGQAIGVDAQMVAFVVLAAKAWDEGQKGKGFLFTILAAGLAFVAFTGVKLANFQQAFHVPIMQALFAIGISPDAWVTLRSGVLVAVSTTGAYLLFTPSSRLTQAKVAAQKEQMHLTTEVTNAREEAEFFLAEQRAKRKRDYAAWQGTAAEHQEAVREQESGATAFLQDTNGIRNKPLFPSRFTQNGARQ